MFCQVWGASVGLSSGYHPQTNSQTEQASLHCGYSRLSAHNSLVSSTTSMSPFMVINGFQSPLLPNGKPDVVVPSVQAYLCHVSRAFQEAFPGSLSGKLVRSPPLTLQPTVNGSLTSTLPIWFTVRHSIILYFCPLCELFWTTYGPYMDQTITK